MNRFGTEQLRGMLIWLLTFRPRTPCDLRNEKIDIVRLHYLTGGKEASTAIRCMDSPKHHGYWYSALCCCPVIGLFN